MFIVRFFMGVIACFTFFVFSPLVAWSDEFSGANLLVDSLLGCEARYDDNGNFLSIKCPGEADMPFTDARNIRLAKQKAVNQAKANLVKFMNERISVRENQEEMIKTLSERSGDSQAVTQKSIETITNSIIVSADEIIKGAQTIYMDVDNDKKTAIAHVGVNLQTMRAADQLKGLMRRDLDRPTFTQPGAQQHGTQDESGRTIQRSKSYDQF